MPSGTAFSRFLISSPLRGSRLPEGQGSGAASARAKNGASSPAFSALSPGVFPVPELLEQAPGSFRQDPRRSQNLSRPAPSCSAAFSRPGARRGWPPGTGAGGHVPAVFPLGVLRLEKGRGSCSPSFSPLRKLLGFLGAFPGRRHLFPDLGKMVLSARRWTGSPLPGPGGGRPAPPGNRSACQVLSGRHMRHGSAALPSWRCFPSVPRFVILSHSPAVAAALRCRVSVIKTGRRSRPGGRVPAFRPLALPELLRRGKNSRKL